MSKTAQLVEQVCTELDVETPELEKKSSFTFRLNQDVSIEIRDLDPGCAFFSRLHPFPQMRREELLIELMRANHLGQLTGKTHIGLSEDEKFLTLSAALPYEINYQTFRESLEDFVNFLLYWREEVKKHESQQAIM